ncbi:MAG: 5-formyltetrahydrofolate cyclo-ligase [Lachnospiraceae bacterium]|nr:5-formyltetrahydrofolate cyclo-ligase [Lachnospiraceae bacterium]
MRHEEKRALRKEVLARRDALHIEKRKMADMVMADRIIGHQWFYRAEVLLAFVNYGSEISTEEIILEALKKGKKVFVPKVEGQDMVFYRISTMEELQEGYKGIKEPVGNTERFEYEAYQKNRMLLLMPGVAFDMYGNRMGYGKGFYDRFLVDKELLQTYSIGIGYACQRVEQVPVEEHDLKPYQVILL